MCHGVPSSVRRQRRVRLLQEQDPVLPGARSEKREGERVNDAVGVPAGVREPGREPAGGHRHASLRPQSSPASRGTHFPQRGSAFAPPTPELPHSELHLSYRL